MNSFTVRLNAAAFAELNARFPQSRGSGDIGKRAMEIVRHHFKSQDLGCRFVDPPPGADLAVVLSDASEAQLFEVKGTAEPGMAWTQLKISSKPSYDLLVSGVASVLRVTDVYGSEPVVYELRCGQDFRLEPEPRWTFRQVRR